MRFTKQNCMTFPRIVIFVSEVVIVRLLLLLVIVRFLSFYSSSLQRGFDIFLRNN